MENVMIEMRPLAEWVLLLLTTTFITWLFYRLTFRIERSIAEIKGPMGPVSSMSLKFGGPAALFGLLIWLGKAYIPDTPFVEINGEIRDTASNPVAEATVSVVSKNGLTKTDMNGKYSLRVPRAEDKMYDIFVAKDGNYWMVPRVRAKEGRIVNVDDFPSGETVVTAKNLVDQFNEPIDGVQIYVLAVAEPQGGMYTAEEGQLDVKVKPNHYWFIYKDRNGNVLYRDKRPITPGRSSELPSILSEQE